ncbi:hypothetical protein EHS25_007328 [Saitozyma podzolica]|uniref:Uncharacterized protein n=1 Tax=Saitozyma podzolica TaxID=1890683 RepID=A0A427XMA4_9TREE|nr:hypothetical protein EHS25_007328 [Saitozyma podzolica]
MHNPRGPRPRPTPRGPRPRLTPRGARLTPRGARPPPSPRGTRSDTNPPSARVGVRPPAGRRQKPSPWHLAETSRGWQTHGPSKRKDPQRAPLQRAAGGQYDLPVIRVCGLAVAPLAARGQNNLIWHALLLVCVLGSAQLATGGEFNLIVKASQLLRGLAASLRSLASGVSWLAEAGLPAPEQHQEPLRLRGG